MRRKKVQRERQQQWLNVLRTTIQEQCLTDQHALQSALSQQGIEVHQSTLSRALKKLGIRRGAREDGLWGYMLPTILDQPSKLRTAIRSLVTGIVGNGQLILIKTYRASASSVAEHLDQVRPNHVLGTLAGDDTVLVIPASATSYDACLLQIKRLFGN